tara:strand:+ start:61 stop:411 length:351 start_codon:yes stop_codon:yes gene_type:complete
MLYPSISNALESRPRSVFDLKLSQSKGGNSESNFAKEVAWLYDPPETDELCEENKIASSPTTNTPQSKNNIPTDCLFFDQFISLHQSTERVNGSSPQQNEHRVQVTSYLNKIVEST